MPPHADRLLELVGIDAHAPVTGDFSGWSKRVLLAPDRVVLFPRDHTQVAALHREEHVLGALGPIDLRQVPRLLGSWDEPDISALPFIAVSRLPGVNLESMENDVELDDLATVMTQVGRAAAAWHALDPTIVDPWPPRRTDHRRELDAILGTGPGADEPSSRVAARIGELLDLSTADADRCTAAIDLIRAIPQVLVHSDLHAGQMLVDPDTLELTGIIDWQGARLDHPFVDVDLGEWSTTMWRRHRREFARIQKAFWSGYGPARNLPDTTADLCVWVWAVAHAVSFDHLRVFGSDRELITGTRDEAIATARGATESLPT